MDDLWNERAETMGSAELRQLESQRLTGQIAHNYATSAFLAAKLDEVGATPADIRSVNDLASLPFMEKAEIVASQEAGAVLGGNQCAALEDIVRIQGTGGTTGQPMRIGWTRRDIASYGEMGARALWAMGCRPSDLVFTCMNFSLYAGGLSDHLTFETLGATTIPYGVGQTERLLRMMAGIDAPVALWATPSYAVRLADVARDLGMDPRSIGLKKGYFSGEAGLQVPGYRDRLEEVWGMRAQDMYGTGELGLHSGECEHRQGLHYGGSGFAVIELIDPDTGSVLPFVDGQQGEVVYTSIWREACPVQRLRSHDLMQVFTEPCACGRTTFRFRILGRSDDMFIVKGVNVFPLGIQATLLGLRPAVTGEFQVVLDRAPPIDYRVPVLVEVARDVASEAYESLERQVVARLRSAQGFSSAITLVPDGTIAGEGETRRVVRASATRLGDADSGIVTLMRAMTERPHDTRPTSIRVVRNGEVSIVTLVGDHDLSSAPALREALDRERSAERACVLDLRGAALVDSAILSVLHDANRQSHEQGLEFPVVLNANRTSAVRCLVKATMVTLRTFENLGDAVEAAREVAVPA